MVTANRAAGPYSASDSDTACSTLAAGSNEVETQLSTMKGQVAGLVDADWGGAASESFRDLWDKWNSGANQLHGSIFDTHRNNALGKARTRKYIVAGLFAVAALGIGLAAFSSGSFMIAAPAVIALATAAKQFLSGRERPGGVP